MRKLTSLDFIGKPPKCQAILVYPDGGVALCLTKDIRTVDSTTGMMFSTPGGFQDKWHTKWTKKMKGLLEPGSYILRGKLERVKI